MLIHVRKRGHRTQSHWPNRHETDLKPTKIIKFGERSVYSWYWFGFVGLVSVYVRADKFVGEKSFEHVWKISPRQIVGCLSVIRRCGVGFVGEHSGTCRHGLNSATDGRWFVGLRPVMYRAYVGRPDTDSRPIQDRIKSDINTNWVESADTFPNQNWRVPDISQTQTECKPITVFWHHTYI